ncbi:FAD-binding domain containing protein [Niveomyces insectorum RCEF 264]|uniref:FAD synthase n=1 Tax=Niveomyces insectorum RCEF 264 TaxID=1081102 RepID=A0A167QVG7_9HYPO|nr:FAD-binding domain containing protein [Niveomyces insectorum RCEF 264]
MPEVGTVGLAPAPAPAPNSGGAQNGTASGPVNADGVINGQAAPALANGQVNGQAHGGDGQPVDARRQHPLQPPLAPPSRRIPEICYKLRRKVLAFLEQAPEDEMLRNVQNQVRVSMDVIEKALQRYALDELSLSYNGGKDCLVLLILILACLPTHSRPAYVQVYDPRTPPSRAASPADSGAGAADNDDDNDKDEDDVATTPADHGSRSFVPPATPTATPTGSPRRFQAIYIVPPDPFPEVDVFVEASSREYHLDLARYPVPMRAALDAYLRAYPSVRAIFMGTRRTDPHGEFLTHFTPTDAGWPQFMRVHPVIDWHYAEIWAFIRHLDIPFCSLYNRGFTSLGGTTDTRPNPALARVDDTTSFRPAYELMADDEERLGRAR